MILDMAARCGRVDQIYMRTREQILMLGTLDEMAVFLIPLTAMEE